MISGSAQFDLQAAASPHKAPGTRRYIWFFAPIILILLGIAVYALRDDFRAYALLAHFEDPNATGPLLRWESYPVTVADAVIPTASGPVRARLYSPVGVAHPRGMLVVHGIHHLGIDEPRLMNFSRAVAGSGLAVLTPQIDALADYHVDAASIPIIGESAAWFDERLGTGPVTVTGISFGGGLSLLAACDPSFAPHFRALALMGTYDDLARVSRFLATSQEELPDGRAIPFAAQDYGASVFVYAQLDQFFPAADLPAAHEALRNWLWEQPENAQPWIARLSPASRAIMEALIARRIDEVRPQILSVIQANEAKLEAISPRGHLAALRVPVFILHGSVDNVIPPAESLWLEQDVPREDLRAVLITGALSHADPTKGASLYDELRLAHFVGGVLRAAN
jgi:pimeloyl-ACP methyl ester carboxylesterase